MAKRKRKDTARLLKAVRGAKRSRALATAFLRRIERPFDDYRFAARVENEAAFPRLAKLLPGKRKPRELWEVWFEAKDEPKGRMHAPGMIFVIVDPDTENCAIAP